MKIFTRIASVIFGIIAVIHIVRLAYNCDVTICNTAIPIG